MKTFFVIDDHPVVTTAFRLHFRDSRAFRLIGTAADAATAPGRLERLERERPDLLVVDLVLGGAVRLSLVSACRRLCPDAGIVVFTSLPARQFERDVLAAGADAYLSKDSDLGAVEAAFTMLAAQPAARLAPGRQPDDSVHHRVQGAEGLRLTPREAEIGGLIGRGYSVARIAAATGASPKTVSAHRDNIRAKLDCRDSTELVARLARIFEPAAPNG